MAIKVGNSYVSEAGYAYANQKIESARPESDILRQLSDMFPDSNIKAGTGSFQGKGTNNISIAPNILKQMQDDPEKRLEYEALIYDCNRLQRSFSGQFSMSGIELVARGFTIDSDGKLSSWAITKSGAQTAKSSCILPKKDPKSWLEKMLEYTKPDSSEKDKLGWRA